MRLIALIIILTTPVWVWASEYICIEEDALGYYYNEDQDKWQRTLFSQGDENISFNEKLEVLRSLDKKKHYLKTAKI